MGCLPCPHGCRSGAGGGGGPPALTQGTDPCHQLIPGCMPGQQSILGNLVIQKTS